LESKSPLGVRDFVKYPFLDESIAYIKPRAKDYELGSFESLKHPDLFEKIKKRIIISIRKGVSPVFDNMFEDIETELLSFLISMIIVRATDNNYIISRFALAEARRSEFFLRKELKYEDGYDIIRYIFQKITNFPLEFSELQPPFLFKLNIIHYLKLTENFHNPEWKLVNRIVGNGYVFLKDREVIRLIREGSYRSIIQRITSFPPPVLSKDLQGIVEEAKKISPALKIERRISTPSQFPPCIERILDKIETGANLSHFERFFLTTYLLSIGWEIEKIVNLFSKMPDFKENITRYQVEHIAGLRGGRIKYYVPSCKLLASHGLCLSNEGCGNIKNPLRFRGKRNNEQ